MATRPASKLVTNARERALKMVESSSRVRVQDLRDNPGAKTTGRLVSKKHNQAGHTIGQLQHAAKPPLGWIWGDFYKPWHRTFPGTEHMNRDINLRREYVPLSVVELARLVELGWLDPGRLIDLPTLVATQRIRVDPTLRQFGVQLTEEGADLLRVPLNVEVQWASPSAIAAIERAGGRIRTAYYDGASLPAACDPEKWFLAGRPVPPRRAPPPQLLDHYADPKQRGYLASDEDIAAARRELAAQRGYELPDRELVESVKKAPNQLFVGIPPGALVSLADKKVFLPEHPTLREYYGTEKLLSDHPVAERPALESKNL